MYVDFGKSIVDTYNRLIEIDEITCFHIFVCLVSDELLDNIYTLIPYTGTYQELQKDPAFTEYHYWRAVAEKKNCDKCEKIYFASKKEDNCPYCKK